jgi:bifunctional DNA-binding transcriptional regulator/antitoxin component of YhaV-PrlF toxin-antitoxin module
MHVCKLYNQGCSMGVTVPAPYRRALGWKFGDLVYLELTKDHELVIRGLREQIETRKQTGFKGAGQLTKVNKHLRVPRD